ncbi:hypothetical protein ABID22_000141 [Pontibacter aydingkolensis]|uniref:Minor tail protein gp31 C-terminal domain-containing protein n=1 Tax=Pontibacter aydingkolensis TaxID=1911536 RepID=A0ABS7CQQ8_9BACT|nr:hypothetical protein [Pontibacter aydingkolensis]MBW7466191.1 hypothetical protein [Pontibacter aydingkolensis]
MKLIYEALKQHILTKVPEVQDVRLFNNQVQNMEKGSDTLYLPSVLIEFSNIEYGHKNHLNQYGKASVKFHIVTEDYNSSPEIGFTVRENVNRALNRYSDGVNFYPLERVGEEPDTNFTNVYVYVAEFKMDFIHYLTPETPADTAEVMVDLMITETEKSVIVPVQDEPAKIVQGETVFYLDRNNTYTFPEYSEVNHTHDEYALKTDLNTIDLSSKADVDHIHPNLVTDDELSTGLALKADTVHTHPEYALKTDLQNVDLSSKADVDHNHNDIYYTQADVDNKIIAITTNLDWRGSVDTYAQLATTYPSPLQGWTVTVNADGKDYRYNGTSWVDIGNNSVPMASTTVDGRMSKTHFTTVNNLPTTHYTKTEADTAFKNASNLTTGTVSDSRLSTNIAKKNEANTFTSNVTVGGDLSAAGFTRGMLMSSGHSNWLSFADKRFNVTMTENGVPTNSSMVGQLFNGRTNAAYSFLEPNTKCPMVIEITGFPTIATTVDFRPYFLGWRDGGSGGGFKNWKVEMYCYTDGGSTGPQAWVPVLDRTNDTTTFPFTILSWNNDGVTHAAGYPGSYLYATGIRITINEFIVPANGRVYLTHFGARYSAGAAPWDSVGALSAGGGEVYGDLNVDKILNRKNNLYSSVAFTDTGVELSTSITANVAAKSINVSTSTSNAGDLHQFIKGSNVVARIDHTGKFYGNIDTTALPTGTVTSTGSPQTVSKMWVGTQAQYDAIATKDANTIYFIQ